MHNPTSLFSVTCGSDSTFCGKSCRRFNIFHPVNLWSSLCHVVPSMVYFSRHIHFLVTCPKYRTLILLTVLIRSLCKPNFCKTHSFDCFSVQATLRDCLLAFISKHEFLPGSFHLSLTTVGSNRPGHSSARQMKVERSLADNHNCNVACSKNPKSNPNPIPNPNYMLLTLHQLQMYYYAFSPCH